MFHGDGWSFVGMHLIWWLVWIVIISSAFTIFTPVPKNQLRSGERALDILRRRYAAGQVSTEEYEQRKAVLERDDPKSDSTMTAHQHR